MRHPLLLGFVCVVAVPLANAQQAGSKEESAPSTFEFGFEQRVRNENWNNILDYSNQADDEREQIRYRTRFWFKAPVSPAVDVFVGLNQETNQKLGKDNRFDEVVFESAYIDIKKLFVKGLSLRVGRQNLMRGEGFIMLEGNPGDGSRSIYFNAVDLAYSWKKSKLELIGIYMPKYDRFFPSIHDQYKLLQDWDQSSAGLYYTDANHRRVNFEAYYLYTKEVKDYLPPTNLQFQPDKHLHTLGGRAITQIAPGWSATAEFAGQWGAEHPDIAVRGWGGYGYLKRQFTHRWKPYLQAGWWGMSGDDPNTKDRVEGWDPLYARWPKWSELYLYSFVPEKGVGYWTNLAMWQGEAGFAPTRKITARLTYYHMTAFQPYPGSAKVFGSGLGRGDNIQTRIDYVHNKNWRGHIEYESQFPGSFYQAGNNGYFLRFEVSYMVTTKMTGSRLRQALGFGAPAAAAGGHQPL
jgi:hypothetical protein